MSAIEHEMSDDEYEDFLTEIYGQVDVCGYPYDAGHLLHEVDPIAFSCGQSECTQWECSECGKVYEEEDDAEKCCPVFACPICGAEYDREGDAYDCEESHEEDVEPDEEY